MDSDVVRYVAGKLSSDHLSMANAHLSECEICRQKLDEAARLAAQLAELNRRHRPGGSKERRSEARASVDESASIKVLHPFSPDRIDIRVIEVSQGGLKLLVPQFLQNGSVVQIHVKGLIVLGEVRHCSPAGAGFHVGLSLQDVFPNTPSSGWTFLLK